MRLIVVCLCLSFALPGFLWADENPSFRTDADGSVEYRMRFWDAGEPNGDWSAVQKVMVGV